MKFILASFIAGFVFVAAVPGQILISSGTYSQNFDSLSNSGTSNPWTDNSTLPGWYAAKSVSPNTITTYRADDGSYNGGLLYSFGTSGSTDRALGSIASGTSGSLAYGVCFTNDTGSNITNILISYNGEQWHSASGSAAVTNTLAFSYQVSALPLTDADAASLQSWTDFSALDFDSPFVDTNSSSSVALDGNASTNQRAFQNVSLAGVVVQPGEEIFLRWRDVNDSGNDAGLAIDDLIVSFTTGGTASNPPVILSQPANVMALAGDTVAFSVVADGTGPLAYQWKSNSVPVPGETNDTITLNNVTTNMSGSVFSVSITNTFGATNSANATLTVSAASPISTTGMGTRILRIVTYNLEADITLTNAQPTFTNVVTSPGAPLPGLIAPPTDPNNFAAGGVLAGIGEELVNGNAQSIDVLALQETTSNPTTVVPIVNALNTFYDVPGMYSNSTYQATESSNYPGSGNGPNAIIYNTRTVRLLASVPVDPPGGTSKLGSSSGEYREVMRYQFAPAGVASNADNTFYVYVSHYKSGTGSSNANYRNGEATIIRSNAAMLSATARILHVGDFNTGDTSEPMYGTLIAPGTDQFLDPINPAGSTSLNWDDSSLLDVKTESAILLHYRDDYQMMTTNVYYGTDIGLALVAGSYHVFGNNGSTAYFGSVNSGSNTSLNNRLATNGPAFISAEQIYVDLTGASDHLPVVADYAIPVPAPKITGITPQGTSFSINVTNVMTNAVYTLLTSTNLTTPLAGWTPVMTNIAVGGSFVFTATNTSEPAKFFRVRTK